MELNNFKIIQSLIVLFSAILLMFITSQSLKRIQKKFGFLATRILVSKKIFSFLIYTTAVVVLAFIWGVDEKELLLFISSFLTILGVALFAQWSILSNITASLILYISYPLKIGDTITVLEKDNDIKGEVKDIGAFYITLKTSEKEQITIPNSIFLQKNVKYKSE